MELRGRREIVESIARTVLGDEGLVIPVDVCGLVGRLGGLVEVDVSLSCSRASVSDEEGYSFIVRVCEKDSFELARMLGHVLLHMGYLIDMELWGYVRDYEATSRVRKGYSQERVEVEWFAYELVMPEREFVSVVYEDVGGFRRTVVELAELFGVSERVVLDRGRLLGVYGSD